MLGVQQFLRLFSRAHFDGTVGDVRFFLGSAELHFAYECRADDPDDPLHPFLKGRPLGALDMFRRFR